MEKDKGREFNFTVSVIHNREGLSEETKQTLIKMLRSSYVDVPVEGRSDSPELAELTQLLNELREDGYELMTRSGMDTWYKNEADVQTDWNGKQQLAPEIQDFE